MKFTGLLTATLVLSAAFYMECRPKNLPVSSEPEAPEQQSSPIVLVEPEPEEGLVAGMVKTPCFGSCPAFEALVYSNGKVTWRGDRNVSLIGHYEARVNEQWIAELLALAEQYNLYGMKPHYPADGHILDDVPHTLVVIHRGKETVRIDNQADAPLELQQFEKYFLQKLMELDWDSR